MSVGSEEQPYGLNSGVISYDARHDVCSQQSVLGYQMQPGEDKKLYRNQIKGNSVSGGGGEHYQRNTHQSEHRHPPPQTPRRLG